MRIRLHLPFSFFVIFLVTRLPLLEIIRRQYGAYTELPLGSRNHLKNLFRDFFRCAL